jgi:L-rhamnono-1,4-lactonase
MKFSGVFSQLPAHFQQLPAYPAHLTSSPEETNQWIDQVVQRVSPWAKPMYKCFGGKRVIWGSDWPVCNVIGGKEAWSSFERVTKGLLSEAGIGDDDQEGFWWENARRIYNIKTDERESSRN